jgi:DNA-binding LacI/PurR family transcriptional regulator
MVFAELRKTISASDDELLEMLDGWELHPYICDSELAGVQMVKGTEFHFVSGDKFKFNRQAMREHIKPHMDVAGFLTTRLQHGDSANERFNKLFGFKKTWADENFQYFILTELPFGKGQSCQQ